MATEGEPDPKRIRSSDPDLKVVIGSEAIEGKEKTGGEDNEGAEEQQARVVTKWYQSQTLATKSKYIDALLAAPMKERKSRTITFPDITPQIWELMMKFIDDPIASRTMKAEDVAKVAEYYDKYEFTIGTKLCDLILEEYFQALIARFDAKERSIPDPVAPDVDFIVNSFVIANHANLPEAVDAGMVFILRLLRTREVPVGRTMFSQDHMKRLAPFLNEMSAFAFDGWDLADIRGGQYDLKSDQFPEKFVRNCSDYFTHLTMSNFISTVELSGSLCNADGHFKKSADFFFIPKDRRTIEWDGAVQNFYIRRRSKEEGWAIIFENADHGMNPEDSLIVETVAYRVPYSGNLSLPPSKGWVSAHPLAKGDLKLTYHLNQKVEV